MRRLLSVTATVGAVALAAAVCTGFAARDLVVHGPTTGLLVAGTALCLAAVAGAVVVERRPGGLVVPAGMRLPTWRWSGPMLLVAMCTAVAGAYASPPFVAVGAVLAVAAAYGAARQYAPTRRELPDRPTVVVARRVRGFADRHAGGGNAPVECALEHVGLGRVRVVAVGGDGSFGDVMVQGEERALLVAELAGVSVQEPTSRELGARIRTGPYEWKRMAGLQLGGR